MSKNDLGSLCKKIGKGAINIPVAMGLGVASVCYVINTFFVEDTGESPASQTEKDLENFIEASYKFLINDSTWKIYLERATHSREIADEFIRAWHKKDKCEYSDHQE